MDWDEALKACQEMGKGWRLPTEDEFDIIFNEIHLQGKGEFKMGIYWTLIEDSDSGAFCYDFEEDGFHVPNPKYKKYYVRSVMTK